jgi:DNA-binding beta-propeller fold protein YncE
VYARIVTKNKQRRVTRVKRKARLISIAALIIVVIVASLVFMRLQSDSNGKDGQDPDLAGVINGTQKAPLNGAMGLARDARGNIYVANSGANNVLEFNQRGKLVRTIGKDEKGQDLLKFPTAVAIGNDGQVYVANFGGGGVLVFDSSGRSQGSLAYKGLKPLALAVDSQGNLYVADADQQNILVFDSQGKLKLTFGGKKEFAYINGITVDEKNRRLIIVDSNNFRLALYNFQGRLIRTVKYEQKGESLMAAPRGVAWNPEKEEIYLVDAIKDSIMVLKDDGRVVAEFGEKSLDFPVGIIRDEQGKLYVTNSQGNHISIFKRS